MAVLVTDPILEKQLRDAWSEDDARREEVWEGVLVMAASPNSEHQAFVTRLSAIFSQLIDWDRGDLVLPGMSVSDRNENWEFNYRIPDVVVHREGGSSVNHETHLTGGPDFLIEISSPGEDPHAKLDFYSKIKVPELLVYERKPYAIDLFQLRKKRLVSVGRSDLKNGVVLASRVFPLTFQPLPGKLRPRIEIAHTQTGQRWSA